MNATMKTILIEDWYAPAFEVRINAPKSGACPQGRRGASRTLYFRAAQPGLCRARSARRNPRVNQLALLNHG